MLPGTPPAASGTGLAVGGLLWLLLLGEALVQLQAVHRSCDALGFARDPSGLTICGLAS